MLAFGWAELKLPIIGPTVTDLKEDLKYIIVVMGDNGLDNLIKGLGGRMNKRKGKKDRGYVGTHYLKRFGKGPLGPAHLSWKR